MEVEKEMREGSVEPWDVTPCLRSIWADWHLTQEKKDALSPVSSVLLLQGEGFLLEHCGPEREASLKF